MTVNFILVGGWYSLVSLPTLEETDCFGLYVDLMAGLVWFVSLAPLATVNSSSLREPIESLLLKWSYCHVCAADESRLCWPGFRGTLMSQFGRFWRSLDFNPPR